MSVKGRLWVESFGLVVSSGKLPSLSYFWNSEGPSQILERYCTSHVSRMYSTVPHSLDGRRSYIIITRFKCQQAKITLLGTTTTTTTLDPNLDGEISLYFSVPVCTTSAECNGTIAKRTLKSIHPFIHSFIGTDKVTCWKKHSLICISRRVVPPSMH